MKKLLLLFCGTQPSPHISPQEPSSSPCLLGGGPAQPKEHHLRPALASLVEEKEDEEEEDDKDDEEGPEDMLTQHVRALARARSSYVAKQFRSFRARLTSGAGGPHRPGDPATELLQDVRHLLTDLQDHLAKDPDVRAVFASRGPGAPQKEEELGKGED